MSPVIHRTNDLGHRIVQGSRDWWALKIGKPSASQFGRIIQPEKLGYSTAARGYIAELLAEQVLGMPADDAFEQEQDGGMVWTDRGLRLEPEARTWYEAMRDVEVEQVACVSTDDGSEICSPDGLVGDEGLLELKVRSAKEHMKIVLGLEDIAPRTQVQGQLRITGREWVDCVAWNKDPRIPNVITRVKRDDVFQARLAECMTLFKADMAKAQKRLELVGSVRIDDSDLKAQLLASIALFSQNGGSNDAMLSDDEIAAYTDDVRAGRLAGLFDRQDEDRLIEDVVQGKWDEVRAMWGWISKQLDKEGR